jgi:hypothetical protein
MFEPNGSLPVYLIVSEFVVGFGLKSLTFLRFLVRLFFLPEFARSQLIAKRAFGFTLSGSHDE